jgi:hypothetical protein
MLFRFGMLLEDVIDVYRGHPSEAALFAIASMATPETPALHIVDLTLESNVLENSLMN